MTQHEHNLHVLIDVLCAGIGVDARTYHEGDAQRAVEGLRAYHELLRRIITPRKRSYDRSVRVV